VAHCPRRHGEAGIGRAMWVFEHCPVAGRQSNRRELRTKSSVLFAELLGELWLSRVPRSGIRRLSVPPRKNRSCFASHCSSSLWR
jgi:hypothetical protein